MKLHDLKSNKPKLNWANRSNAQYNPVFDSNDVVLLNVNVEDVINNMSRDFRIELNAKDGDNNTIAARLSNAKEHFKSGAPMDYPEVGYNSWSRTVDFSNGRHRTVAAYQLGYRYIPMFVSKDGLEEFKKIVRIK